MKNNSELKKEFQEDLFPVLKKTVALGLVLIIVLVPVFSWVDYFYYPLFFRRFLYYRILAASVAALLFYLNLRSQNFRASKVIGILGYYVVGLCIILMIRDVNGFGTPYYAGLLMVFIGFIALLPLDIFSHLFHVLVLYFFYVVVVFMSGKTQVSPLFWVNNVFLLSSLAILLTASVINYRKRFEEFVGRKRLMMAEKRLKNYAERLKQNAMESESKYVTVVNNAREGILILRDEGISFCNPKARDILEEIGALENGELSLKALPAQMKEEIQKAYGKAVQDREGTINRELRFVDEGRSGKWFEYTTVPVELGDSRACVLFLRDITVRKQMENELIQSQKMEAIGVMAGGVAHDLNNVFQIVSGYVQMGLEIAEKDSRLKHFLEQIEKAIARASMVARQLLIFARKDESNKEVLDVNSQIVSLTKLLHRVVPKMITIDLRLSKDAGHVLADPVKLEQVLLNLCINARDAMPEGGRLEISTYCTWRLPETLTEKEAGETEEYVCIKVSDTGCGIPQDIKERIFEPFFTTKEKGKGTGLGLSIVYGIVKDHGGFITCESLEGEGTEFSIYLPACKEKGKYKSEKSTEKEIQQAKNETILLVDDEEQIRDIGVNVLGKAGYRVTAVETAETALEYLEKHGLHVDLVLLDLNMPGMGGIRFLEELNVRYPDNDIKIIICTGYFEKDDLSRFKDMGVDRVISKPFKFSEIMPVIRAVLSS